MKTKKLLLSLITAILLFNFSTAFCGDGTQASPYRIFWIGNSNTYMWGWYPAGVDMALDPDLPRLVKEMAAVAPIPIYMDYEFQMSGGANLQWHWENGAQDKIATGNYDFVVLNDHSTATFAYPDQFIEYSTLFDSLSKASGAKPIFFMGWPDDDEWALRRDVIVDSYDSLGSDLDVDIAPCGRAWEIVEEVKPELNLYQDDLHHPNEIGVYMNTCVLYSIITNTPPGDNKYVYGMHWVSPTEDDYYVIENAAWEACMDRLDVNNEMTLTGTIISDHDIQLDWINPESATTSFYGVYQNANLLAITTGTTYTIPNATPVISHNLVVIGMDSDSLELYNSNGIIKILTDVDPPSIPENLRIFDQGTNSVFFMWDASTDNGELKEYIVYLNGVEYLRTDAFVKDISGLQDGTYTIEIAAVDQSDNVSAKSSILTVIIGESAGIDKNKSNFFIYPNPAYDRLMVVSEQIAQIRILNLNGSVCLQSNTVSSETVLDVSILSPGTYIISIISESDSRIGKLVIQ